MTALRSIYQLIRADFLERTRRYSFLFVLGLTVWAGYAFVPPAGASYSALALGNYRGVYNSAWVGTMVAIMTSLFLSLAGFYLVKDAVERDERTGVGQIIAATPLSKVLYVLGKSFSNFLVLAAMAALLALVALAMQIIRGEDALIDLWALWSPFVFVALPPLAVVAATAVVFETIRFLRGGLGNVSYFFVWVAVVAAGAILPSQGADGPAPINDLFGINIPLASMTSAAKTAFPTYDGAVTVGIAASDSGATSLQTFVWSGMAWAPAQAAGRLVWMGMALGLALLAAVSFNRFDTTAYRPTRTPAATHGLEPEPTAPPPPQRRPSVNAAALAPVPVKFSAVAMLRAELRLLLKGQPWWWYAGAAGLVVAGFVAPPTTARVIILPLAWIWPVLIWSGLGGREPRHSTGAIIFSAPRPLRRQLPAAWLAGVVVAAAAGSGVCITLARSLDVSGLLAWVAGALFIPALALALGVLSGGSKLFEVLYVAWWYSGPLSGVAGLDFMGARDGALWPGYLALALGLLVVAIGGRWRQVYRA
jgi:hypothetical protein